MASKKVPFDAKIAMAACGSANYWGSELQKLGYKVKTIHAQLVKPNVKSNKNDAEAICEAINRPNMRFVNLKTIRQQDVQAAHRIRYKLIMQRTAKANQVLSLASEYGLVAPLDIKKQREASPIRLKEVGSGLPSMFSGLLSALILISLL